MSVYLKTFLMIYRYHQKVPPEVPTLELKATYGLASPEEFSMPGASALWTADTYAAFDVAKAPADDAKDKVY